MAAALLSPDACLKDQRFIHQRFLRLVQQLSARCEAETELERAPRQLNAIELLCQRLLVCDAETTLPNDGHTAVGLQRMIGSIIQLEERADFPLRASGRMSSQSPTPTDCIERLRLHLQAALQAAKVVDAELKALLGRWPRESLATRSCALEQTLRALEFDGSAQPTDKSFFEAIRRQPLASQRRFELGDFQALDGRNRS